jgi:uncharacterized membrane protein YoaT (DUF817 family)
MNFPDIIVNKIVKATHINFVVHDVSIDVRAQLFGVNFFILFCATRFVFYASTNLFMPI